MPSAFMPPPRESLAEVDVAKVAYDDRCIVIEGVVSPAGQGARPGPTDGYDVHIFSFAAWRRLGESLVERKLTLLRPEPPSRALKREDDVLQQFPPCSIQRFSVLLSKDNTRAVVEEVLTIERPDQELLLFSDRLRQPVVISTEQFGDLLLNREVDWFEGKIDWNGETVIINLEKGEDGGIDAAIQTANVLLSDQATWKRRIDEFAVTELLPLKNESWLDDGEVKLTAKDFKTRMELLSITVGDDGRFEFWHDDGELFCGHSIQIKGNLEDGPTDADIPG
jgi:hypothetical protein